jgi:transcriptional regulator with XRE-family HTH domain
MNYGKAIKILRSARNFEQQELAKKAGLDSSYISLIEKGKRNPSSQAVEKITKSLSIPKHLLLLLASDEKDLRKVSKKESSMIGRQLLEILISSQNAGHKYPQKVQNIFPILSVNKLAFALKVKPSELKKLSKTAGSYYDPFDRKQIKDDGKVKWRHIDNPAPKLKEIQRKINKILLKAVVESLPIGMTGGIGGRSIFTNAAQHLNQKAVATLDLKDCFPKTNNKRVFKIWRNHLGASESVASILTKLTTFQRRLPQGSPTSSSLCNIALFPLYKKIKKYCLKEKLNLTLYVDDITISGGLQPIRRAVGNIVYLIQKEGYAVRRNKIKIMPARVRQKTTGLIVNKKISVSAKTREEIRKEIFILSRKELFSVGRIKSLWGKINHVKQADLKQGEKLSNLAHSFLLDLLNSKVYERIVQKKDITRRCKCTKKHKYGL